MLFRSLMGYDNYASFVLEDRMAKTPEQVYALLDEIWKPALAKAKDELADINTEIKKEGGNFEAEAEARHGPADARPNTEE